MLIKTKVFPGEKENKVIKKSDDCFEVKIKARPEKGQANSALKELLANYFGVSEKNIKLVKGGKTRNKIFNVKK